ncbi:hypothetical protein HDE69_002658 [Pedobacter cryoconitis]|uniref:Uncharacterized protein n=1 Tax=Pedobacter cryoconitis TaxID=188932 RepID=A0A7W8YTP9_9SPHI|nr:hypothetical protein [Pedobacter cryoconitis]MBB5621597.1 hypothetical protein [Pedobacter cryoconitis]
MKKLIASSGGISISSNEALHVLQNQPAFMDDFNTVYDEVLKQVVKSINHLGFKLPGDADLDVLVHEITKSIRSTYKQLRKEELEICFANGIRGVYGEFMGLSVVSFEKFIIRYLASDYRIKLGKTLPKAELPSPSRELTRQDRINFAQKAYEKFKIAGSYDDLGNIIYNFLDSEKLIPFTTPEKFGILEQARQKEYQRLQNPASMEESRKFNKQIESLMSDHGHLIPKAKKIALNVFFKNLLSKETKDIPFIL